MLDKLTGGKREVQGLLTTGRSFPSKFSVYIVHLCTTHYAMRVSSYRSNAYMVLEVGYTVVCKKADIIMPRKLSSFSFFRLRKKFEKKGAGGGGCLPGGPVGLLCLSFFYRKFQDDRLLICLRLREGRRRRRSEETHPLLQKRGLSLAQKKSVCNLARKDVDSCRQQRTMMMPQIHNNLLTFMFLSNPPTQPAAKGGGKRKQVIKRPWYDAG